MKNELEFLKYLLSDKVYGIFSRDNYEFYRTHLEAAEKSYNSSAYVNDITNAIRIYLGTHKFDELYEKFIYQHQKKEKFVFIDLVIEGL